MYTTRYGRGVKQPERYTPIEEVEDDYSDHEDVSDSDVSSTVSYDSEEEAESDDEDEGSLKEFVVEDEEDEVEADEVDSDSDSEGVDE